MAQDIHNVRLEEFAYAVLILGDQIAAAAEAVGWTARQGYEVRHSREWMAVRARLLDSKGFHDLYSTSPDNALRFIKLMMTDRRELGRYWP